MTIYALSTAQGRAGIAVVRISGKSAREALEALSGKAPTPRFAAVRVIRDPSSGAALDRAIVLWFPAPASFTGEDMAELHVHSGRAVLQGVLDALGRLGLSMAGPGAFTRRAFENGKLDLTEVEGLFDLINAETAAQRDQALAQSSGALRKRYDLWRSLLLRATAYVEASLDFTDEADITQSTFGEALPKIRALLDDLSHALKDGRRGEIIREGVQVTIAGAPNAGKSSILNALAGREAAIVFNEPGTTRDVVEVALDLEGLPFVLRDTAGLRETESAVEQEGIRRARAAVQKADIVLAIIDATAPHPIALPEDGGGSDKRSVAKAVIKVLNKIDLLPLDKAHAASDAIRISAKTGYGLDSLKAALIAFARENYGVGEASLITRARHRQELERAGDALTLFIASAETGEPAELAAEHLREAADALARLTGRLDVEDVLGEIFSEFCIGK